MLFKEDVEQSLRSTLNCDLVNGDAIRALTELYNSLPSNEASSPVKEIDMEIIPDKLPLTGNDFLAYKITKHELQDLADELNEVEPIDWDNRNQIKYSIIFDFVEKTLGLNHCYRLKGLNIYSTNKHFLEIAKERIGEERLIELFKEGV